MRYNKKNHTPTGGHLEGLNDDLSNGLVATQDAPQQAVANETKEVVEAKQKELKGLSDAIALYDRELTPEETKTSEAIESVMQERLQTLLTAVQLAELQIKIDSMAQLLELLKPAPKQ